MALKMSQQRMAGKQVASPVRVGVARRPVTVRAETATTATAAPAPAKVQTEKTGPNFKPLRDINAIMKTLPHRCDACSGFATAVCDAQDWRLR
jgi:3-hydroxyacyl-[acyl-carrier-protein] dehydratase